MGRREEQLPFSLSKEEIPTLSSDGRRIESPSGSRRHGKKEAGKPGLEG